MTDSQTSPTPSQILGGAALSGVINAVINGAIQAYLLWGSGPIPITVDSITAGTHTVLSAAVPLAVSLAMILTAIAHLTLKGPRKPFLFTGLWLVIKHGVFAFGVVVIGAVLWQRYAGTVEVGVFAACVILGLIAGAVSAVVNHMTISAVVERS